MHTVAQLLHNTEHLDALPAALLRARDNRSQRQLGAARWLLRRKADGRYVATVGRHGDRWVLLPLHGSLDAPAAALQSVLGCIGLALPRGAQGVVTARGGLSLLRALPRRAGRELLLPTDSLHRHLDALGLDAAAYAREHRLDVVREPRLLAYAGRDRFRRPLWLSQPAAAAWLRMQRAAAGDGVPLEAVSGFRSHAYQLGIFRRKLARGQALGEILRVNTAPGFSEHHSGHALDIGTPGEPPAEASFEHTPAHAWLQAHACRFGFVLSYPRDNPHGIVHEPWHWCWRAAG